MLYIHKIHIKGLKRFKDIQLTFNKDKNILIGENESGKSTILEAINIVINKLYKNFDKTILEDLINLENKKKFIKEKSISFLPKIEIDLFLKDRNDEKLDCKFCGENNIEKQINEGIHFSAEFDDDYKEDALPFIIKGEIPYEYYKFEWYYFSGIKYSNLTKDIHYTFIDNSISNFYNSINYFYKNVYDNKLDSNRRSLNKNDFINNIKNDFNNLSIEDLSPEAKFSIDLKKLSLDQLITITYNDVVLENKGKGMENLIKTKLSLNKSNKIDIVCIEEPENHLSYSNMQKMINQITESNDTQLILTTHNDMITSGLGLNNVIILNNKNQDIVNLKLENDDNTYFKKLDKNNLLYFILSNKVILVEGAAEYLYIPYFYKILNKKPLDNDISVISCNGLSFKRYINIAKKLNKKVAIITDNDNNNDSNRINELNDSIGENDKIKCFTDSDNDNNTLEVCIYNSNKSTIQNILKDCNYTKYKGNTINDKTLCYMLNKKTESALAIILADKDKELTPPSYIKEALEWIKED